ncbi:mesoderm posterior protein 1, partial [Spea bombifrons]|uniref:mesoderm posterior protein 1 n=1 Tax=Spea bombifrons TaxID=233779 RepID=UPI00234941D3
MEMSSVPLHHKDCSLHQNCVTLYQCGYPSSEGYSSLSPASSTDSCGLSPPYMTYKTSKDVCDNIPACSTRTEELRMDSKYVSEKKSKKSKVKLAHSQRQSASEREKLRMRNISKALQNLRRYLPPSVAPVDKNLTKIETLQLTIRYISHLSAQLGLSEEVLEQRRMAAIQGTKRCPQSIHCLERTHRFCSEATRESFKQSPA